MAPYEVKLRVIDIINLSDDVKELKLSGSIITDTGQHIKFDYIKGNLAFEDLSSSSMLTDNAKEVLKAFLEAYAAGVTMQNTLRLSTILLEIQIKHKLEKS